MGRKLIILLGTFAVWASAFAAPAVADGDPTRDMIREEIDAYMKDQKTDFRVYWKDGLNFATRDKKFKMKIGGRVQADIGFFLDNDKRDDLEFYRGNEWHSGFEFRRLRLFNSGEIYNNVAWKLQVDFAGGDVVIKDAWIQFKNLDECWGCLFPDIMIGHFKEYFSLEELTSSKYITYMERSMPVLAFAPSRNSGIGLFRDLYGGRMTFGLGWYGLSDEGGDHRWEDGNHITARLTAMPWAPCDCEYRFWEVGVYGTYRFDQRFGTRYRTRPEFHDGPRILDLRLPDAQKEYRLGVETALNYDRWSVQGEYIVARPDVEDSPYFYGWYASATYQLNGGSRRFRREYAVFDKTKPCTNFDCTACGHLGQWEIAARVSALDLQDKGYEGGTAMDLTVGVNWYLNPNTRIMFNYVWSDVKDLPVFDDQDVLLGTYGEGQLNIFAMRFQIFW